MGDGVRGLGKHPRVAVLREGWLEEVGRAGAVVGAGGGVERSVTKTGLRGAGGGAGHGPRQPGGWELRRPWGTLTLRHSTSEYKTVFVTY